MLSALPTSSSCCIRSVMSLVPVSPSLLLGGNSQCVPTTNSTSVSSGARGHSSRVRVGVGAIARTKYLNDNVFEVDGCWTCNDVTLIEVFNFLLSSRDPAPSLVKEYRRILRSAYADKLTSSEGTQLHQIVYQRFDDLVQPMTPRVLASLVNMEVDQIRASLKHLSPVMEMKGDNDPFRFCHASFRISRISLIEGWRHARPYPKYIIPLSARHQSHTRFASVVLDVLKPWSYAWRTSKPLSICRPATYRP